VVLSTTIYVAALHSAANTLAANTLAANTGADSGTRPTLLITLSANQTVEL